MRGRVYTTSYEDMIRQSVRLILSTRKGERFIHPEFGCDIYNLLFQPIDYTTLKQMENEVIRSLRAWEPRIGELTVKAAADPYTHHRVNIEISYYVPALAARLEQVYLLSGENAL